MNHLQSINSAVRKNIASYSALSPAEPINFEQIKDPDNVFFGKPGTHVNNVSSILKQQATDLHNLSNRCKEEKNLLVCEMKSVISWHVCQHAKLLQLLDSHVDNLGFKSVLTREALYHEHSLQHLHIVYKDYLNLNPLETPIRNLLFIDECSTNGDQTFIENVVSTILEENAEVEIVEVVDINDIEDDVDF